MILIRSTLFNIAFFTVSFCLTVPGAVARLINPDWVMAFAVLWARSMVVCLRIFCSIRVEVTGLENLPLGPALIASRHQSAFDTFIWLTLLPRWRRSPNKKIRLCVPTPKWKTCVVARKKRYLKPANLVLSRSQRA